MLLTSLASSLIKHGVLSRSYLKQFNQFSCYALFDHLYRHHIVSEKLLHEIIQKDNGLEKKLLSDILWDSSSQNNLAYSDYLVLYENEHSIHLGIHNPFIKLPNYDKKNYPSIVIFSGFFSACSP